jgi:hypothetical protein
MYIEKGLMLALELIDLDIGFRASKGLFKEKYLLLEH